MSDNQCPLSQLSASDVCWNASYEDLPVSQTDACQTFCVARRQHQVERVVQRSTQLQLVVGLADNPLNGMPSQDDSMHVDLILHVHGSSARARDTDIVSIDVSTDWTEIKQGAAIPPTEMTSRIFWALVSNRLKSPRISQIGHGAGRQSYKSMTAYQMLMSLWKSVGLTPYMFDCITDPLQGTRYQLHLKQPLRMQWQDARLFLIQMTQTFPYQTWLAPLAPSRDQATLFLDMLTAK
jgi:hypothetical protein